jgi:hypothetical protein
MIAIGVEPEYRFVARSLSGWGPKGAQCPDRRWERGREFLEVDPLL